MPNTWAAKGIHSRQHRRGPRREIVWRAVSHRPPTAVDVSIIADADMAWMLADAATAYLTGHERMMTFVELGSGESHLAIQRILKVATSTRMLLPVVILDTLNRWLVGYVGSPDEARLRAMLTELRSQQFELVPSHSQQVQCDEVRRFVPPACSPSAAR